MNFYSLLNNQRLQEWEHDKMLNRRQQGTKIFSVFKTDNPLLLSACKHWRCQFSFVLFCYWTTISRDQTHIKRNMENNSVFSAAGQSSYIYLCNMKTWIQMGAIWKIWVEYHFQTSNYIFLASYILKVYLSHAQNRHNYIYTCCAALKNVLLYI